MIILAVWQAAAEPGRERGIQRLMSINLLKRLKISFG